MNDICSNEDILDIISNASKEVFKVLGHAHSESVYQRALIVELQQEWELNCQSEVVVPISYKNNYVGSVRLDIIVNNKIIVELKANVSLREQDKSQLMKYLKYTNKKSGIVINFPSGYNNIELWRIENN